MVTRSPQTQIQLGPALASPGEEAELSPTMVAQVKATQIPEIEEIKNGSNRAVRLPEKGSGRFGLRTVSGRTRQADLQLGQQGGMGALDEAPDNAGQREPSESRGSARPAVSGTPN